MSRRRLLLINNIKDIQDKSFIFTIDTTKAGTTGANSFLLPAQMGLGTTDYAVDWGDGNGWITGYTGHTTKTYDTGGVYTVKVKGMFDRCSFGGDGEPKKVLSVEQWGITKWTSMSSMFRDATNLNSVNSNCDTSNVTTMSNMFRDATNFNSDISNWDTSNVTSMIAMFRGTNFNSDISNWNTSNVTSMNYMFHGATEFNSDISNWDVSNVTNMSSMFQGASNFDQDLSLWCVSLIPSEPSNFDLGANAWTLPRPVWGTCPQPATYFPLTNTSVDPVSHLYNSHPYTFIPNDGLYFDDAPTSFRNLFNGSSDINDSDIGLWDVSNVTNMNGMFLNASNFNQDISSWDVSNVADMGRMLYGAASFDQDISGWDVSNVTNMNQMFFIAASFDQDLSGWDVSNVTDMSNMFALKAMSTENYSNTLIGWSNNPNGLQSGLSFNGGTSKYNAQGAIARQHIIDTYGWAISDGGLI